MALGEDDFREVAHCGGKLTFHVSTDEAGIRGISFGFEISSPVPAAICAVYALPQGVACGDIQLGGIGQPWNSPPFPDCIPVLIGSDSHGKFGHACPECKGYWRSSGAPSRWPITCPYCGIRGANFQFLTEAQRRYVEHCVETSIEALNDKRPTFETVIDMDAAADATIGLRPEFYYVGQTQQREYECEPCGAINDIRGKYGYCCSCGARNNIAILKIDFAELRERLNAIHSTAEDALKSAVSLFDSCCRDYVAKLVQMVPLSSNRRAMFPKMLFHNIENHPGELKSAFDIDILKGIPDTDKKFLTMMFCRRHAYEHNAGTSTERYLLESGDTTTGLGVLIRENVPNVHRLIGLLNRMVDNLHDGFHDLLPVVTQDLKSKRRPA